MNFDSDEASGFDASEPPVSDAVNVTIDDGEPCRVWNNNVGYQSTCELFLCRREEIPSTPRIFCSESVVSLSHLVH